MKLVALVPLLPLIGVLINGLFGAKIKDRAHLIAVPAAGLSCVVAFVVFFQTLGGETLDWDVYPWLAVGDMKVPVGFLVDPLSTVMMLVVTFVGFLIHVYSIGYMHGDRGYARFFTYLNLFMFSMLMLVLANNYLLMFLGWEGVGLCSYLLIGFWYEKKSAGDAGKKAFVVNRIGDAGFILGLFFIWTTFGSLKYTEVFAAVDPALGAGIYTTITLLLFVGATGKSAQLPLYVWLPDAMEGPTPVSALIHAATMVTAGVYMVARSNALFNLAPFSLEVVAWVGALTAVFAATIALVQNDIKKVVAYSTISQLGYMFLGAGAGATHLPYFTSPPTPSSRRFCSSAPARSSIRCTASRTSGRWADSGRRCRLRPGPSCWPRWRTRESFPLRASGPRMRSCSMPSCVG